MKWAILGVSIVCCEIERRQGGELQENPQPPPCLFFRASAQSPQGFKVNDGNPSLAASSDARTFLFCFRKHSFMK